MQIDTGKHIEKMWYTWGICTRRAGKLYKARSRLCRSQILQVNTRLKALAEIYQICIPLHLSDVNNSAIFNKTIESRERCSFLGIDLARFFFSPRFSIMDSKTVQRSALCRSRRELSNEYLLAKIGVDTAENEPCKVCPLSVYRSGAILAQGARGVGAMSDAAAERRSRLPGGW